MLCINNRGGGKSRRRDKTKKCTIKSGNLLLKFQVVTYRTKFTKSGFENFRVEGANSKENIQKGKRSNVRKYTIRSVNLDLILVFSTINYIQNWFINTLWWGGVEVITPIAPLADVNLQRRSKNGKFVIKPGNLNFLNLNKTHMKWV